jgi:hypothetical protein
MTFYAPLSSREVSFTESSAGNSTRERAIVHTLETVKTTAVPAYLDALIQNGLSPAEAFSAAVDSVNYHGGSSWDLVRAYIGGKQEFADNGITLRDMFEEMSDEAVTHTILVPMIANLREEALPDTAGLIDDAKRDAERWIHRGEYTPRTLKQEVMQAYADRLFAASPTDFSLYAPKLAELGVSLTDEQTAAITAYEKEERRRGERGFAPPAMPGF